MEKIEILDNGETWDVEPCAPAEVATRFEELDAERRMHYAAMAGAGVLPEEAPFPREREWRVLRDRNPPKTEAGRLSVWSGIATVLAIPGVGVFFGLMAALAAIAEEGGF
ncbi:MAG: hypothetical protein E7037_08280 [Verrucomicrobia bacterium]|nr:hypothetical protein [Verrucomicrobiota bacterium]